MVSRVFQLQDSYRGRVGFYGGTFDPIHNTYRKLGEQVGHAFHDGVTLK